MFAQLKRDQENQNDSKYGVIQADNYKYYCPFCYEITEW